MARALINVPPRAKRGEIIEIKTLISHPMETGFRRTQLGALIPRDIIRRFVCTYNGDEVFRAELFPAISANPFIAFTTVATESGTLEFDWTGDNGYRRRSRPPSLSSRCRLLGSRRRRSPSPALRRVRGRDPAAPIGAPATTS